MPDRRLQTARNLAGGPADYALTIAVKPVELAPNRIVSTTTCNGQFHAPLLRFKEGQPVTIDINNQTDTPEQLHWHGQFLSTDVDGGGRRHAVHSRSRKPAHHVRPEAFWVSLLPTRTSARGANLGAGQYTGMVGPGGAPGCREVYEKSHGNQQSRVV